MISNFKDLNQLFKEIDCNLSEKTEFYVIGGAMLLYYGLKEATKDIDIIVDSQKEFIAVERVLKKIGFATKLPTAEYNKVNLSQMFIREDFRIDLFYKIVCKGFQLSETMKNRTQKVGEFKHLKILLCAHEDVFLFKTFTERPGDIEDCLALAQKERAIDWQAVLEEVQTQIKISGNEVWVTWVGERLDILEERGLEIPIMKEIDKLREDFYRQYEK